MTQVVNEIRRVTDIMGEISAASDEQSVGVAQIGEAVTQMDQVTQQNAALVEEMAAAASSLKSQAQDLVTTVAIFELAQGMTDSLVATNGSIKPKVPSSTSSTPKLSRTPVSQKLTAPARKQSVPVALAKDDSWETF
jgi:methyl-accepting chemotaxis protein